MSLYTYLSIKQAAGPRYASDATPEEIAEWAMNDIKGQQAIQQIPELQSQLDEAIGKNNKYYFYNEKNESNWKNYMAAANEERDKAVAELLRQQQEKYDANEANWQNYMTDAIKEQNRADAKNKGRANTIIRQQEALSNMQDSYAAARERAKRVLAQKDQQISDLNEELKYHKDNSAWKTEMYKKLQAENNATNKQLNRADAKNRGRADTIRRQEEQITAQNNTMNRMRRNASIGGTVGGAALGGGAGYMGSNWLANKLKLTGRKALAAKLLGTATGTALGGAGGYYLGRNI